MDKTTHQIRREQWAEIITTCLNSGMKKATWCKANGIREKQFYYWQRILRTEAFVDQKQLPSVSGQNSLSIPFVELKQEKKSAEIMTTFKPDIIIRKDSLTLEISNTVSSELLSLLGGLLNAK